MNDPHGLTKENMLLAFPVALQQDETAAALAEVTARLLARRPGEIDRVRIYPAIDRLDEQLLDILAYDFKVDWWDPNYSLEEKRRTLKGSWYVHKKLGTKAAVETALRAIYPTARAEPWFEYEGGEPYHFRIHIDLSNELWAEGKPQSVLDRVRYYQSLRDHMDSVQYTMVLPPAVLHIGGGVGMQTEAGTRQEEDEYEFRQTVHTGGAFGPAPSIGLPQGGDRFHFQGTVQTGGTVESLASIGTAENIDPPPSEDVLRVGGRFSARAAPGVPKDISPPSTTTILRTGGVCTIISNLSKGE